MAGPGMPGPTRPVVLIQPVMGAVDASGQQPERARKRHHTLAQRQDRPSDASGFVGQNILGGQWQVMFRVREHSVHPRPEEGWRLIDEHDQHYEIEGVFDRRFHAGAGWLDLVCVRSAVGSAA